MRKKIYDIIEVSKGRDKFSAFYDMLMLIAIIISIVPLAYKSPPKFFVISDVVTSVLFIIDYILRWITADLRAKKKTVSVFLTYPLTPWAIVDLVSILPGLLIISGGFRLLRLFRLMRTFRVLRVFKVFRYSRNFVIISKVIKNSKDALLVVCTLVIGYILVSALMIFNVEGETFGTFFDAVYWATISLTTVGYGDIYPVTTAGKAIAMISSVVGIAIVALPSGIITAGYMEALDSEKEK